MAFADEIEHGEVRKLVARLKKNPNLDKSLPGRHVPPLMYALRCDQNDAAQLLLDAGADPGPPLAICAGDEKLDAIGWLLDRGVDVDAAPGALRRAASFNKDKAVALLLSRGAGVDLMAANGETPLIAAAEQGALACALLLLDAGARVDLADHGGRTAAHAAAERHGSRVLAELARRGALDVRAQDAFGWTALHHAAAGDLADSVRTLIAAGAELDARTGKQRADRSFGYKWPKGGTPLHAAASTNAAKVLPLLLEAGANINEWDGHKNTPLHLAGLGGARAVVELLLARGARIDLTNKWGWSVLHCAAKGRRADDLIEARADRSLLEHRTRKAWKAYSSTTHAAGLTAAQLKSSPG